MPEKKCQMRTTSVPERIHDWQASLFPNGRDTCESHSAAASPKCQFDLRLNDSPIQPFTKPDMELIFTCSPDRSNAFIMRSKSSSFHRLNYFGRIEEIPFVQDKFSFCETDSETDSLQDF